MSSETFSYKLKTIPTKGRLVYEYNPLYNFRIAKDRKVGENTIKANSIYDLDTNNLDGLNFDLNHPVDITCLNSYDGSVNLILNDGKNTPKLINSRFSLRENNTYEIIDREGTNVTNIYDEDLFESDTSLYKKVNKIPKIDLYNVSESGQFKVGNYVFYLTYSDADDNETDFVAESGIVSCFVGANGSPQQINGGYKDWNSHKAITFKITNIDKQYDYLRIYYSRASSDIDQNVYTTAYKIVTKYPINSSINYITVTGEESTTEIPLSELNALYFLAASAKTQALCKNRLFFGNITKVTPENKDLKDLSLRIYPSFEKHNAKELVGELNYNYTDTSTIAEHKYAYYDVRNIYNYVGYWPEEIYRFGIVYILKDGSLSPVYNILGVQSMEYDTETNPLPNLPVYTSNNTTRYYLPVDESTYAVDGKQRYNAKGVVKFPNFSKSINNESILSIKFNISEEVLKELRKYSQGYFFVRQKRIPTILCQGITLETDIEADVPMIPSSNGGVVESFINSSRVLSNSRSARLVKGTANTLQSACLCPDYDTNEAFLNLIFTGAKFYIKKIGQSVISPTNNARLLDMTKYTYIDEAPSYLNVMVAAVLDSAPIIAVDTYKFRARCGEEGNAHKFRYIGSENKTNSASNLVRGLYGRYLGLGHAFDPGSLINIYIQGYDPALIFSHYYKERFEDTSLYYAISNRQLYPTIDYDFSVECFRGDSYIATNTHRLNRNFQDPNAPLNDIIVEPKTWKLNYDVNDLTKSQKINRGDVNAVKLGTWFTMTVRSTRNLGLRSVDLSYPSEQGMFGHPRGFYPYQGISASGEGKLQESSVFNAGFLISLGERWHFVLPNMPYIKNVFLTRIAYSDIAVSDAFKNGYRVFLGGNYRDYTFDYGSITKLIEFNGNLMCTFEHGVALIPVNERTLLSGSTGGDIFINTNNILPDTPLILSSNFGSLWAESVIKTPKFVYGIDTVARKIWRTDGKQFACISDFTVQRFLNENISLSEFEFTPIIGVRNVKTHYNAFKLDVMFTFYDNTKGDNEVAWNLCFNELTDKFVTFYSWLPSFSANINNIFFSFDRTTSKVFSQLARGKSNANEACGITISNYDIADWVYEDTVDGDGITIPKNIPYLTLSNQNLPEYKEVKVILEFNILKDRFKNYNKFEIQNDNVGSYLKYIGATPLEGLLFSLKLECKVYLKKGTTPKTFYASYTNNLTLVYNQDKVNVTNWFWKHGQAGIFDSTELIKPTKWYGITHPFEFECIIVANSPSLLKIFTNLQILSNKAAPESFHFEVVGEGYEWRKDKEIMYYRQEATKCLFYELGSDITYDYKYLESTPVSLLNQKVYTNSTGNTVATKSTIFPLIYIRLDKLNEIQDTYGYASDLLETLANWKSLYGLSRVYHHLSGSEIVHDSLLDEYKVCVHLKGVDSKKYGRMRGNMEYREDNWDIQINSIIFALKNENNWPDGVPPIAIIGALPNDVSTTLVSADTFIGTDISNYSTASIDTLNWGNRKEARIRDKYLKVKVRYSGEDLAIVSGLVTLFNKSYA